MTCTTRKVLHENADTGNSMLATLEEVRKDALEAYASVVRDMLTGKRARMTHDGTCYVVGCETNDTLSAELYHVDYDFCLMSMTVYPPEWDGASGRSILKLDGVKKLQDMHADDVTPEMRNTIEVLGDAGRVLAWAWLIHKGHVNTYA